MPSTSVLTAHPTNSHPSLFWLVWAWMPSVLGVAAPAHAAAPQLQVESSAISGGDQLAISADGRLIAEHHKGIVTLRDGQTGRSLLGLLVVSAHLRHANQYPLRTSSLREPHT